ncbi:hypothetical protein E4H12_06315 [Candidatus Thorarchaeota archaeon]|nr:MAG: hypothetical protein E4H12_06315 [Candidatus Thorarchaeota archaeon]
MLLFEVLYTKCKICKAKLGKGGRDHRFGVCDKHVNEGTISHADRVSREKQDDLKDLTHEIAELLWQDYQDDLFLPAGEERPDQMSDEDYLDFEDHVGNIVNFARAHRLRNPQKAIMAYQDEIRNTQLRVVRH